MIGNMQDKVQKGRELGANQALGSMLPDAFAQGALSIVVRSEWEPVKGRLRTVPANAAETRVLGRAMDAISHRLQQEGQDGEAADRAAQQCVMEFVYGLSSGEDNPITVVVLLDSVPLVFIDASLEADWDRQELVRQAYFHFMQQQADNGLVLAPDVALVLEAEKHRRAREAVPADNKEFTH